MEISEELNQKKNFFFDLDNTLWTWESLKPGAEELIHKLRESDKNVYFHTDNTLLSRQEYAEKLSSLGIETSKDEIFTTGYNLGRHLSESMVSKAYVIGESGLVNDLEESGIEFTENAETVIMGFDRQFNYRKARKAFEILSNGGRLYICSTERYFETSLNKKPHQGSFNPIFDDFEKKEIAGKPGDLFVERFEKYFDYSKMSSVFIGDRLDDIEAGNKLGMTTGAFTGGNLTKEKLKKANEKQRPDFGISDLSSLRRRIL